MTHDATFDQDDARETPDQHMAGTQDSQPIVLSQGQTDPHQGKRKQGKQGKESISAEAEVPDTPSKVKTSRRRYGEGSIYQRKDGRYAASLRLENGERKTFYGKTRKEVAEKLRIALNEKKQGTLVTGPQQKVSDYFPRWLDEVKKPTIRLSTYHAYKTALYKHILPALGHFTLQKLKAQHIQELYAHLLKEGYSSQTIMSAHKVLRQGLANAVKWNLVARNEASLVTLPRIERHEVTPLTEKQVEQLLTVAKGHFLEEIILLAVATGMRFGELLALRWADIDLGRGILVVQRTVSRVGKYGLVEREPKTRTSRRKIMLPGVVVVALKWLQAKQELARLEAGDAWQERGLVFCDRQGNLLEPERVRKHFYKLLDQAGLPRIHFHDLRHSAATILLIHGVHPKVVQELLGHSTISMTLDTYSHLIPSLQAESMQVMNTVLDFFSAEEETQQLPQDERSSLGKERVSEEEKLNADEQKNGGSA
jgi:integrase